jgi:D-hydroxyproline dehydrogenase subunit beta
MRHRTIPCSVRIFPKTQSRPVMPHLLIVGAGIVGLAHAVAGVRQGWRVTLIERHPAPCGASTQNFGLVWPIGQALGPDRARALRSRTMWSEMSAEAGFHLEPCGSLILAYHDDARSVLQEFTDLAKEDDAFELLPARAIVNLHPSVRRAELQAGLFSRAEARVDPVATGQALIRWLTAQGVTCHFGRPVTGVFPDAVVASDGVRHTFDRLVICNGDELTLLYPDRLATALGPVTHLQMLRTAPMPAGWSLAPALAAELTMPNYASFAGCPSLPALRERLQRELPVHTALGIHVLAVQSADGSLVIGDSHTTDTGIPPSYRSEIESHILTYLNGFLRAPELTITHRWLGSYVKGPPGSTFLRLAPSENIQIVTGLGGAGMTLSFALAEETLNGQS